MSDRRFLDHFFSSRLVSSAFVVFSSLQSRNVATASRCIVFVSVLFTSVSPWDHVSRLWPLCRFKITEKKICEVSLHVSDAPAGWPGCRRRSFLSSHSFDCESSASSPPDVPDPDAQKLIICSIQSGNRVQKDVNDILLLVCSEIFQLTVKCICKNPVNH